MEKNTSDSTENIKLEDPNLPDGWKRDVKERPGKNKTKHEVNIISPEGKVFKTPLQLEKYLKSVDSDLKSSDFDFSLTGKSYRKKRKSGEAELSDTTENEPRRRSGRIQMKLRSQEGENSGDEIEHVELKSPKKSNSSFSKKLKKDNTNEEVNAVDANLLKEGDKIQVTETTQKEQTTIIKKDEEGNVEEIISKTVITEQSDIDIVTNNDDTSLKVLDSYIAEDNLDNSNINESKIISQSNQPPEIQVEKTTITTSFVENLETKDKDMISDMTNSSNGIKNNSILSHIKENGEHENKISHPPKDDSADMQENDTSESSIYSIKHSILTSQTTTTIETSSN